MILCLDRTTRGLWLGGILPSTRHIWEAKGLQLLLNAATLETWTTLLSLVPCHPSSQQPDLVTLRDSCRPRGSPSSQQPDLVTLRDSCRPRGSAECGHSMQGNQRPSYSNRGTGVSAGFQGYATIGMFV